MDRPTSETPVDGIKVTSKGLLIPWGKLVAGLMSFGAIATPIGAFGVWRSHGDVQTSVAEKSARLDDKLDLILAGQKRTDSKIDGLEERVRGVELVQARQDGEHKKRGE